MGNILKYLAYISVILNVFSLVLWIFIFNMIDSQQDRVASYSSFIPFGLSIIVANALLIVLTITSIIVFTIQKPAITKLLIIVQALFLCLYVWQVL